jgi:hypothetical protein
MEAFSGGIVIDCLFVGVCAQCCGMYNSFNKHPVSFYCFLGTMVGAGEWHTRDPYRTLSRWGCRG